MGIYWGDERISLAQMPTEVLEDETFDEFEEFVDDPAWWDIEAILASAKAEEPITTAKWWIMIIANHEETSVLPINTKIWTSDGGLYPITSSEQVHVWNDEFARTDRNGRKIRWVMGMNSGASLNFSNFGNAIISLHTDNYVPKSYTDTNEEVRTHRQPLLEKVFMKNVVLTRSGWFLDCYALRFAKILGTFTTLEASFFKNCFKLDTIELAESACKIYTSVFENCRSLKSFDFSNINTLGTAAFKSSGLEHVEILENITSFSLNVFYDCNNLKTAKLNFSANMSFAIFYQCYNLKYLEIGELVTILPNNFCYCCNKLEKVVGCVNVETVGSYAFQQCYNLKSFPFSSVLKNINSCAFGNSGIEKVHINASSSLRIHALSFQNCIYLSDINLKNIYWMQGDSFISVNLLKKLVIDAPNNVGVSTFTHCSFLAEALIRSAATSIDVCLYSKKLKKIEFDCPNLTELPSDLEYATNLEEIIIWPGFAIDIDLRNQKYLNLDLFYDQICKFATLPEGTTKTLTLSFECASILSNEARALLEQKNWTLEIE